jgi:small subunit ribosomal protein S7e
MAVGPEALSEAAIKEKLAAFDSVPLFMRTLPDEETDDPALSALQSLAYEGTPDGG